MLTLAFWPGFIVSMLALLGLAGLWAGWFDFPQKRRQTMATQPAIVNRPALAVARFIVLLIGVFLIALSAFRVSVGDNFDTFKLGVAISFGAFLVP